MNTKEIKELFDRIKRHYTMFTYDDKKIQEWHRFLKDYDKDDVYDNFDNYITFGYENAPLVYSLIKNIPKLKESAEDDSWLTKCDICGKEIRIYNNDMSEYDKHYRKCQKISFIDLMCMRYKNNHIPITEYYEMDDEELDKRYRKIMDFYVQNRGETEILKKMPEE